MIAYCFGEEVNNQSFSINALLHAWIIRSRVKRNQIIKLGHSSFINLGLNEGSRFSFASLENRNGKPQINLVSQTYWNVIVCSLSLTYHIRCLKISLLKTLLRNTDLLTSNNWTNKAFATKIR